MPNTLLALAAISIAYLIGSLSFAVICSRLFGLADPRSYGSKNPGATNVLRSGNKLAAALTLLADLAKGAVAVMLAQHYSATYALTYALSDTTIMLVAVAVFLGHIFPVFFRFKGGKGVATAAGVLLALDPKLGGAVLAIWLLSAFLFRYSSLAALLAAASAPLLAILFWGNDIKLFAVGVIAAVLISKHWGNLQRLMAGLEPKIGAHKASPVPAKKQKQH